MKLGPAVFFIQGDLSRFWIFCCYWIIYLYNKYVLGFFTYRIVMNKKILDLSWNLGKYSRIFHTVVQLRKNFNINYYTRAPKDYPAAKCMYCKFYLEISEVKLSYCGSHSNPSGLRNIAAEYLFVTVPQH